MHLSTAQMMALEVLKGDLTAAKMLADALVEEFSVDAVHLPPIQKINCSYRNIRVVFYLCSDVDPSEVNLQDITNRIQDWLLGRVTGGLVLRGIDRLELYQLPDNFLKLTEDDERPSKTSGGEDEILPPTPKIDWREASEHPRPPPLPPEQFFVD